MKSARKTYTVRIRPGLLEGARKFFDVNTMLEEFLTALNDPKRAVEVFKVISKLKHMK